MPCVFAVFLAFKEKDPLTDWSAGLVAAVLGFEPKITESESVVLPLHYTATNK